jgi:hypothetical protein
MSYDNEFDDAQPEIKRRELVMDEIPDGRYEAQVIDVSYFEDRNGVKRESWWFRVRGGPFDGSTVQRFSEINRNTAGRAKGYLLTVARGQRGNLKWSEIYDKERRASLPWLREECVGAIVNIAQRTSKGHTRSFVDIYINGCISPAPVSGAPDPVAQAEAPAPPPKPAPADDGWDDPSDEIPF